MKFSILSREILEGVPSASGLEYYQGRLFVVGDDSPWLFELDNDLTVKARYQIHDLPEGQTDTIPKIQKPDFEATCIVADEIWVFGSGSKPATRDTLVRVNLKTTGIRKYSLTAFYDGLCSFAKISRAELNLEGAASDGHILYLLNRGENLLFQLKIEDFLQSLAEQTLPTIKFHHFILPEINGQPAGFSGASLLNKDLMYFVASAENTQNWIDDGEILGSAIGCVDLTSMRLINFEILHEKEEGIPIKIESITILNNYYPPTILLVTDSDGGDSEILKLTPNPEWWEG
jgi:hypothetical protein